MSETRFKENRDRVEHRVELKALIEARLSEGSSGEWYEKLAGAGVPCGRVQRVAEALAMAGADSRGLLVEVTHPEVGPISMVGNPVRLEGVGRPLDPPPGLGEHTNLVLHSVVGLTAAELEALREQGVVG